MTLDKYKVAPEKLRWTCDPGQFEFTCTNDLAPLRDFIGQERAVRAIEFGLSVDKPQYNIYVSGLSGTGKTSLVKSYIEKVIAEKVTREDPAGPEDWCYVYNFTDPDRPRIANVAQGKGKQLRDQVESLLKMLKEGLQNAFSSEEYRSHIKRVVEEAQGKQQKQFEELSETARQEGFLLEATPSGPMLIPLSDGKPIAQSEFLALDEETRKGLEAKRSELSKKLHTTLEQVQEIEKEKVEQIQQVDKDVGEFTIARLFYHLVAQYGMNDTISRYLTDLKTYTLDHLNVFKAEPDQTQSTLGLTPQSIMGERDPFLPFKVTVFVDNSDTVGPPVIVEANPNYGNVFGKIERRFLLGGYLSDHTMLKPGAINLANGGYLLMNAQDVLTNPGVWPTLKRAIKNQEARIEDPLEQFGLLAPQGMKPEPMPVNVKIVLIGDSWLYQMLSVYDEDFWEIFKVKSDFNYQVERTQENIECYATFISGCCQDSGTRPFDPSGVARVIEYAARLVADQDKLSSRFAHITELIEEAEYWASRDGMEYISSQHVQQAIDEKVYRHNMVDEHIREMITRGTIMIDTEDAVVGQVNGLSVYQMGDITFGKPSRITATTYLGRSGIVNIERESQLSGRIHDKGVLILSGYLGHRYAQDQPLSLSASLCFEQSYEGVEGDSASSTELYAILSSLSGVPIKQGIAVTGSVNQRGEIQPIGGVNHKIEGFFEVCNANGLSGEQGVLIPHRNLKNLMLREEVVEAVKNNQFHIYSVKTIDEGIEVITGKKAGEMKKDGTYPDGTINALVHARFIEMAEKLRRFQSADKEKKENGSQE